MSNVTPERLDKKQFIETTFAAAVREATKGYIMGMQYDPEIEKVYIYNNDKQVYKVCNVAGDSKMACMTDILKALNW